MDPRCYVSIRMKQHHKGDFIDLLMIRLHVLLAKTLNTTYSLNTQFELPFLNLGVSLLLNTKAARIVMYM